MRSANKVIFSGVVDQYYKYCYGQLEYRSLHFEHEVMEIDNFQGNAVVNYTEREVPYTRVLEHKHFEFGTQPKTIITKEYPKKWEIGLEPYYPVNTDMNQKKLFKYQASANREKDIYFGGRLGAYKYYDMDQTVEEALRLFKKVNG